VLPLARWDFNMSVILESTCSSPGQSTNLRLKQNYYLVEFTTLCYVPEWGGGEQESIRFPSTRTMNYGQVPSALTWQKTLPNYAPDPAAIAAVEAKAHPKIIKYLQKFHTEVAGTKHVQYLRPEDGVPMEE
jgi:hypothetical protein